MGPRPAWSRVPDLPGLHSKTLPKNQNKIKNNTTTKDIVRFFKITKLKKTLPPKLNAFKLKYLNKFQPKKLIYNGTRNNRH